MQRWNATHFIAGGSDVGGAGPDPALQELDLRNQRLKRAMDLSMKHM